MPMIIKANPIVNHVSDYEATKIIDAVTPMLGKTVRILTCTNPDANNGRFMVGRFGAVVPDKNTNSLIFCVYPVDMPDACVNIVHRLDRLGDVVYEIEAI